MSTNFCLCSVCILKWADLCIFIKYEIRIGVNNKHIIVFLFPCYRGTLSVGPGRGTGVRESEQRRGSHGSHNEPAGDWSQPGRGHEFWWDALFPLTSQLQCPFLSCCFFPPFIFKTNFVSLGPRSFTSCLLIIFNWLGFVLIAAWVLQLSLCEKERYTESSKRHLPCLFGYIYFFPFCSLGRSSRRIKSRRYCEWRKRVRSNTKRSMSLSNHKTCFQVSSF